MQQRPKIPRPAITWFLALIATMMIGVSLVADLGGQSWPDQFILARWSEAGLRIYLWLEGGLLAGSVAALGGHVISTGFALTRGIAANLFGMPRRAHIPAVAGYVFVVLGSALVTLSLTMLVLLNSCRYMRLV
ncbi:MAG: hypothetical protein ACJ785_12550 [Gemmatimonadaceae bacterium]